MIPETKSMTDDPRLMEAFLPIQDEENLTCW